MLWLHKLLNNADFKPLDGYKLKDLTRLYDLDADAASNKNTIQKFVDIFSIEVDEAIPVAPSANTNDNQQDNAGTQDVQPSEDIVPEATVSEETAPDDIQSIEQIEDLEATAAQGIKIGGGLNNPINLSFGNNALVDSKKRELDDDEENNNDINFDAFVPTPLFTIPLLPQSIAGAPPEEDLCITFTQDIIDSQDGKLSLREALIEANSNNIDNDVICLGPGIFELSIAQGQGDDIDFLNGDPNDYGAFVDASGDLDIIESLIIEGAGVGVTFIDGNQIDRIFEVREGVTLTLRNLTLTGGNTLLEGGAILNRGNLILENVTIDDNEATRDGGAIAAVGDGTITMNDVIISNNESNQNGAGLYVRSSDIDITITDTVFSGNFSILEGGGIYIWENTGATMISGSTIENNQGSRGAGIYIRDADATITESTIRDNGELLGERTLQGGGMYVRQSELILTQSTISGNDAERGGGLFVLRSNTVGKELFITNSTLSGNESSKQDGGGLYINRSTVNIDNSTITDNTSNTGAALVAQTSSTVYLESTIVAQNTDDKDIAGSKIISQGYNLVGNEDGSKYDSMPSDIVGSLSGSGVESAGLLPLADNGGPTLTHALDGTSQAIDAGSNPNGLITDQRGGEREVGVSADIGAYESDALVPPIVLDLDNDGIELTSVENGVQFDVNQDGTLETIAWVGADDALLVYDYNRDGLVTHINEFSFVSYHEDATTDLHGLRLAFDTNQDNVFDNKDSAYDLFGIWQDANQNGVTEAGEFTSLKEANITSLALISDASMAYSDLSNQIFGLATYSKGEDTYTLADVGLQVGTYNNQVFEEELAVNHSEL